MDNVIGINRDKLKATILKLYTYRDRINQILNEAQNLIDDTSNYYKSDDGDEFRRSFNKFYSNKRVLIENIKSYCNDLEQVINNFDKNQLKVVDIFNK